LPDLEAALGVASGVAVPLLVVLVLLLEERVVLVVGPASGAAPTNDSVPHPISPSAPSPLPARILHVAACADLSGGVGVAGVPGIDAIDSANRS